MHLFVYSTNQNVSVTVIVLIMRSQFYDKRHFMKSLLSIIQKKMCLAWWWPTNKVETRCTKNNYILLFFTVAPCNSVLQSTLFIQLMYNYIALKKAKIYIKFYMRGAATCFGFSQPLSGSYYMCFAEVISINNQLQYVVYKNLFGLGI